MAVVLWPSCALAGEWLFDFGAGVPYNWGPEHQVAMNASGEAALIFGFNGVRVSLRTAGGYFEAPEWGGVLVSAGGIEGTTPDVAIDNRGDVVAVWEQYTDRHLIYEATKPTGGSFGAPVEVSSESEEASSPNVAIDDAGEATVAWLDHSGGSTVVRAASATLGQPFSTPVGLSGEPGNVSYLRVTVNNGGDTIVSWDRGGSQLEVMVRRAGTSWPANGAHDYGTVLGEVAASSTPSVTIDGAGEALAVWTAPGGTSYAARVAPHMVLFGAATALTGVEGSPSVAMNEAGEAAMSWQSGRSVQVATAPPAGTFGTPVELSSSFAPSTTHVSIGAGGNIAVEWEAMNERESFGREGSSRTPAGTFAKPHGLFGGDLPVEGSMAVASDSAGDMIGVWDTTDLHDMESMLYDAGPQLGAISAAATGIVGQPVTFSIPTPASTWKPLQTVTWNFGDDTTANGLSVSHVYSAPGTYQITASASDTQYTGLPTPFFPEYVSNSESQTITVSSAPMPATTTLPVTPSATDSVSLAESMITVRGAGEAAVRLRCTGTGTCRGKLILTGKRTTRKGKEKHTKMTTIGTASFSIPAGKTATIELELNTTGRALLSADHGHLSASLTILKSSPSPSQTHIENVQLVQQKAHGHAKK